MRSAWWAVVLYLGIGCGGETAAPKVDEPIFVRGGLVGPDGFEPLPWTPGQTLSWRSRDWTAPKQAECISMYQVPLGDVSRLIAVGGGPPDTALAWSPDERLLAIGTFLGEVLVVDGQSGEVKARRRLGESLVKQVRWSADGQVLYAAEQSPDAVVRAMRIDDLQDRWTLSLADRIGRSPPPAGEDLYAIYNLPAAYTLFVLPDGDLLVGAAHGWTDSEQVRQNRSQILRLSPEGEVRAVWPEQAADAVMLHSQLDGDVLAVPISRSAAGPPPTDLPIGGVQLLKLVGGASPALLPKASVTLPPLSPWFKEVFIWENLDVSSTHDAFLMGLGDGRVGLFRLDGQPRALLSPGVPILAGAVPIASGANFGQIIGDEAIFLTTSTTIPWGAASPELRPSAAHPAEHTLRVVDLDGELRWTWHGAQALSGLAVDRGGQTLVVGAGPRDTDRRRDLYGALVFDLGGAARSGEERLSAWCPTENPVFFRQAVASDGRIGVVEYPYAREGGQVEGAWRVTVFR